MKPKRLKLDWDQLEDAFNNQNDELVYFLDLITGQVHLEGEGEEDDDDDDESYDPNNVPQSPRNDQTRAYVEPPDTKLKIDWLTTFIAEDEGIDEPLRESLETAMGADDPTSSIRGILNQNPEIRDRWYLYRTTRIQELIGVWLTKNRVETTNTAPWA